MCPQFHRPQHSPPAKGLSDRELVQSSEPFGWLSGVCSCASSCCSRAQRNGPPPAQLEAMIIWTDFSAIDPQFPTPERPVPPPAAHFFWPDCPKRHNPSIISDLRRRPARSRGRGLKILPL